MNRAFILVLFLLFAGCCSISAPEEPPQLVDFQLEDFQGILDYEPPAEEIPPEPEPELEPEPEPELEPELEPEPEEIPCPEWFEELEEYGCNFSPLNEIVPSKGVLINLTFIREKNCTFDFMNWTDFEGYFLVFFVDAENTGTQKEYLTPSHFTLFDSEGRKRTASEFNVLYCASRSDVVSQTILTPNEISSGELWFEVSERNITGQMYVVYDRNGVEGEELIFPVQIGNPTEED